METPWGFPTVVKVIIKLASSISEGDVCEWLLYYILVIFVCILLVII